MVVTGVRLLLGAGVLACVPPARRGRVARSDWPRVLLLGVLWMALPLTLFPIAQQTVDSAVAGMLTGAQPLLTALVAAVLLLRRPRGTHVVGLVIGFVGIFAIAVSSLATGGGSSLGGVALILVAVSCYAVAVNLAVPLQQRYGSLPVVLRTLAVATVLVAPLALFAAPGVDRPAITPSSWVAVALLGVVSTGLAYAMFAALVGRAGSTRGASAIYLIPVVAVVLGVTVGGEHVQPVAAAGAVVVLAGAWLSSRAES